MTEEVLVAQSPRGDGYIELARTQSGKLFRKQILRVGQSFVHPSDKKTPIVVTSDMANRLVENFHKGYCDTVQFPVTDDNNVHTESVLSNLGEVIDLERDGDSVNAIIDARKHADDVGKTILGASAFFSLNYQTEDGKRVGPTLLHVAATNRPYLTKLKPYEEMVAASSLPDSDVVLLSDPDDPNAVLADTSGKDTNVEEPMELTEMLAALRDTHGIDVAALQESANQLETAQEQLVSVGLSAAGDTDDGITQVDLAEAIIELSNTVSAQGQTVHSLRAENDTLIRERTEAEVDGYVRAGRILPKQRSAMVDLALSNRPQFDVLLPDDAIVALSESGVTVFEEPEKAKVHDETVDKYVSLAVPSTSKRKTRG